MCWSAASGTPVLKKLAEQQDDHESKSSPKCAANRIHGDPLSDERLQALRLFRSLKQAVFPLS